MFKRILLAAALSLGLASAAHAADFNCYAKIGPASAAQNASPLMGTVSAANLQAAEAEYFKRASATKPVSSGRWVIHELYCVPLS
ncbi:hypothetical protein [Stenotrophomonas sp. ZAC14A_NAIMI4_1]|uniref:hypothetical protein n=1 Tax=Stenotrophomonas sp. ZAC14A_NAIMI4_1 TaxID=2072412 RepID=UPI000D53F4DA|nr:hypothetical protein [Stenotrophomonas sp. ZAC14A_NAIMI4_1]AWH43860.1 hypothetical protein C1926_01895 [Stenotrophomonas sp. ZAC14A_NAIMI4_1]